MVVVVVWDFKDAEWKDDSVLALRLTKNVTTLKESNRMRSKSQGRK